MNEQSVIDTVRNLQALFTVVLGLGLGEAFKQFVSDKAERPQDRVVRWNRLPALIAFLVLIVPFYHGIDRFFYNTYETLPRPEPYAPHLVYDVLVFLIQSSLFFLLSRELPLLQWRRFYHAVIALIGLNSLWVLSLLAIRGSTHLGWFVINAVCALAIFVVLKLYPDHADRRGAFICLALLFVRTILDYALHWSFYFPS